MIPQTARKSLRQQFADTMLEVGKEDPRLTVLIGDISHFVLQPFHQACPGRFYNVGICEPNIMGMAAGLAKTGLIPVAHTIAPFLIERSFEQIKLDFCYQKLGGNLITVGSAFDYSNLGCSHHCYDDFALLKCLEGTEIVYPATALEFDVLFREVYDNGNLTLFRLPAKQHLQDWEPDQIQFGKGVKVKSGSHLTMIVTGPQLQNVIDAETQLAGEGWDIEILYLHTIRPLDVAFVRESVAKTRRVLVVEEHMTSGGLGDDVLRSTHDLGGIEFDSLSIPDQFVRRYGRYEDHCERLGLTREGILKRTKARFGR